MKFEVYKKKQEQEKIVYFELRSENRLISLIAVDGNGNRIECGDILSISKKGIHLSTCVNAKLGLPLGKEGKIVVLD